MNKLKALSLIILLLLSLSGCEHKNTETEGNGTEQNGSDIVINPPDDEKNQDEREYANYRVDFIYPEGLSYEKPIELDPAVKNLTKKLNFSGERRRYSLERVDFINDRVYYIIRGYEDHPEHIFTFGYYAIDVLTGSLYYTEGLTNLVQIEENQSNNSETQDKNDEVYFLYPDGVSEKEPITFSSAIEYLSDKLGKKDEIINYTCKGIQFINNKIFYIISSSDEVNTYYAVEILTGAVYDTKNLTDMVLI